ncbi:ribonuclease III [Dethiosulfatarculus sandiegensis]|nr:ribonuclease III [Dethiosulfatarculus sandiegensis]
MDDERQEELEELAALLGHKFNDLELLATAMHHSSYVHEHADLNLESNERLEFLGDAVLELCVTEMLYQRFPAASEGRLSKARASMVNEHRLAAIARSLNLGGFLLLGRGEEIQSGSNKPSILADALEAVLAATYLDGGLEVTDAIITRLLGPYAEGAIAKAPQKDFKTRIQEFVQEELHVTPRYQLLETQGPDHDKTFRVALSIKSERVARGVGKSKKEAEQNAARRCLELIEKEGTDFLAK